jgi:PAS domain S-box-containing protein
MSADPKSFRSADDEVESLRQRITHLEGLLDRGREAEHILGLVLDSMDVGVVITDEHGRLIRINSAGAKMIGGVSNNVEAINRWFASAYLPDGCTPYPSGQRPLMKAVRGESVEGEEILFLHPESWEAVWLQVSARPLTGSEGTRHGALLTFRDVTLQKRALTALRETEQRFVSILENTPAVVYLKDAAGKYLLVNRAFEDAFGRASEAVVGLTDGDLFNAATADLRRRNDRQVLRTGQPIQFEETVPVGRMDKTYLSVIFPLCDARQSPYALCGISTDIDQRKQSEERLRSEQSFLKDLIRAHEHDRQLMAYEIHDGLVQYMSAGLMHLECLAAMRHELSSKEQASLELAMHLVRRSIAEGRRVMSGLRPPILDEEGVVLAISYLVAEQMSPSELQVDFHHRVSFDRLDPLLEGTIFRIVQEALTNIKRHSQARRAEVRLTQRDHRIHLQIRDWGIGFDADQVPGDRFGLKGILKRADLVGGQARLVSKPGEGTTILVDLPVTPALS